jgi:hypothetical protein
LFSVCGFNDFRQTEVRVAEPLVPEPSSFEFEMAFESYKSFEYSGIDPIATELIPNRG